MIDYRWPCPTCNALVYGLGQHMTSHGRICKTSGPIPGGGVQPRPRGEAPLGERGSLGDPPSPLGEPDVSFRDTSGSVPPRTGGEA